MNLINKLQAYENDSLSSDDTLDMIKDMFKYILAIIRDDWDDDACLTVDQKRELIGECQIILAAIPPQPLG